MAQVTVTINGFPHVVGCEDGQESHLLAMAAQVEARIRSVKTLVGQGGEARALVLAALLMADELHDIGVEMNSLRAALASVPSQLPLPPPTLPSFNPQLIDRLGKLTEHAEKIAEQMEQA
jgi:cell division protein ZapA